MPACPYPVNLDLDGRPVLVVGGGRIAATKATGLADAGARVTVVAPEAVSPLTDDPRFHWQRRPYHRGEVASYRLAVAATGDPATAHHQHGPTVEVEVHGVGAGGHWWFLRNMTDQVKNTIYRPGSGESTHFRSTLS